MRHGIKNRLFEVMAELDHLFVVAAGTKPAPSATEGEQILVLTVRTSYSGKALMKIATFKVFLDNMIYNRAVKPIPLPSCLKCIPRQSLP
jgi:hypothetical protein